ncbi:MAG: 3-deoxy-manno-octulosonate cytidylyltransferase, partial [Flavobacteriia bacterium]|nr:3-deoxy-manno-octulosonate cytidylyltransferase [Flavobacteriia bacterium]
MKILGVIPARYQSSRFPGKPLIDLKGKSMIQRVYDGTDDERIFEHVLSFGGKAKMTSPNHHSGTERCQ